jgi:hypothetical protein
MLAHISCKVRRVSQRRKTTDSLRTSAIEIEECTKNFAPPSLSDPSCFKVMDEVLGSQDRLSWTALESYRTGSEKRDPREAR